MADSESHPKDRACRDKAPGRPEPCLPPVSFTTFVLSLASSAMVHLGETPDPESGGFDLNLPLAKHTIDILATLECKTRGNLTGDEGDLLLHLLRELRLAYVKKAG